MPQDKKTKIKEQGKQPIGKKSERKALHVQTRRAKKGLEELCDGGGCSDLLLYE